jgi:hypothetical protein
MKYLKCFDQASAYEAYKNGSSFVLPNISYIEDTEEVWYYPVVPDMWDSYLTIEALEDGLTAKLSRSACEYCVDGDGNWKSLAADTATESINAGQTLSFRGNLTPEQYYGIGTFTISNKCNIKGNCMSMLFGDNAATNFSLSDKAYAFYKLFQNCANIVNVSSNFLPATTLVTYCYSNMFNGCTALTETPKLPSTTLVEHCYQSMFSGCTSLTYAPELPATVLKYGCYSHMFNGCTSLTTTPALPAMTLVTSCYENMFYGCTNLTTVSALPAINLANDCYKYMFYKCSNLIAAPALPATTLASGCYGHMFDGCSNLTTAPELPATKLENRCYECMFWECTNLTTAPELPAATLKNYCYWNMFYGCAKLNYIKMLATNISAYSCLDNWVKGVASTGKFIKKSTMTSLPTGESGIPKGWTVQSV